MIKFIVVNGVSKATKGFICKYPGCITPKNLPNGKTVMECSQQYDFRNQVIAKHKYKRDRLCKLKIKHLREFQK